MRIDITYDSSVMALQTSNPTLYAEYTGAVTTAVDFYESLISTPITVNISFGWGEIDGSPVESGALAESDHYTTTASWSRLRSALEAADSTSVTQKAAAALLASENTTYGATLTDDTFVLATAEAAALGLNTGGAPIGGFVGMDSTQNWAWTESGVGAGQYDAVGTLEHEISEDLGREASPGAPDSDTLDPLNLFEYSAASASATSPGSAAGALDLTPDKTQGYFSYNGTTITLPFGSPADIANGDDVGDWTESVEGDSYGFGYSGMASPVSATDLQVMNALGYDFVGPTVSSIDIVGASANDTGAGQFTVTFSENVTGVATDDFVLTDTGTVTGAIASVAGSGASYTVTVDDIAGAGTMRLDLKSSESSIVDGQGDFVTGGYTSGQSYTIAPPTIAITGAAGGQAIVDRQTDDPFSAVSISDTQAAQTLTLSAVLSAPANGALSHLNGGSYNATTGIFTITGSASLLTAALDGLVFTPSIAPGATATTSFTLSVSDGADPTVTNSTTSVTVSSVLGGGQSVGFTGAPGHAASLYDTDGDWDGVSGADGAVYLTSAQASVSGGGDAIDFAGGSDDAASLYDTSGAWDGVGGTSGTIYLTNAEASISGGGQSVDFAGGSGDAASLYATAGDWDSIAAAGGRIYLTNAQASITGGDDVISFAGGSGAAASLYGTTAWDLVGGSNGTVYLTSARASVVGGGDTVDFAGGSGNATSLYGTGGAWDGVDGASGAIYLTNAQASVTGGGDTIVFAGGSGDAASLYGTNGDWDVVSGSSGLVYLTSSQASVVGSLNAIDFAGGAGDAASLYATNGYWDTVNGSNGTVYLTGSQSSVIGGGDVIDFNGGTGDIANLAGTAGAADTVIGAGGTVNLYGAQAIVSGAGETIGLNDSSTLTLNDGSEVVAFNAGIGGLDTIAGFASSDTIQLSKADFANFAALSGHLSQSGANAVITLDAADAITLTGVTATSLTAAEFAFV